MVRTVPDKQVKLFKALGNPTRLSMVRRLAICPSGDSCGNISAKFMLSQPTISHHFQRLIEAEIIIESKVHTQKSYQLNRLLLKKAGINVNKL